MKTESTLEKFFDKHLYDPVIGKHTVISGMGLATLTVTNSNFIGFIREYFKNKYEVQAEFSYFRNKFLHYSPTVDVNKSFGSGNLFVRLGGDIFHFVALINNEDEVVVRPVEEGKFSFPFSYIEDDDDSGLPSFICEIIEEELKMRYNEKD